MMNSKPFAGSAQYLDLNLVISPPYFADGAKETDDFGSLSFQNHLDDIHEVIKSRVIRLNITSVPNQISRES